MLYEETLNNSSKKYTDFPGFSLIDFSEGQPGLIGEQKGSSGNLTETVYEFSES